MDRQILHCDMNGFYASVELLDHPELRDVPVAVAGDPESRHGIILAKNDPAKKYGIVTAETVQSAMRKCPGLTLLKPHREKYVYFSEKINEIYRSYTDLVEPFSIDESWLDVTGSQRLFGSAKEIADEIRHRVKSSYGLTLSVGVSFNKIFAKMGSEYRKPDATTVISRENYRDILWPQPVGDFFYVGKATADKLNRLHIYTVGELANADPKLLQRYFGAHGMDLYRYVNGLDDAPVRHWEDREDVKSIGHGITFRRNLNGYDDVSLAVTELSDMVSARMRRKKMKAYGVKVEITDPNFHRVSRQRRFDRSFVTASEIRKGAMQLIRELDYLDKPIRLLTVTAINLAREDAAEQMTIFDLASLTEEPAEVVQETGRAPKVSSREKDEKLERTMDEIRNRFGTGSIGFAHGLGNDLGIGRSSKDRKDQNESKKK